MPHSTRRLKSGWLFSCLLSLVFAAATLAISDPADAADGGGGGAGNVVDSRPAPGPNAEQLLALNEAYRSGFFELSWSALFEVYDAAVKSASGFSAARLSQAEAQDSLDTPGILLSTVYTGMERIRQFCPPEDEATLAELDALQPLLESEDALLTALLDWYSLPGPETEALALRAKDALEKLLADTGLESAR